MSMLTQKERIEAFIAHKKLNNKSFEEKCGLGNGFVSKIGKYIRQTKLDLISISFPELNMEWIERGSGTMLKDSDQSNSKHTIRYEKMTGEAIPHIDIVTASCGLPNGFNSAIAKGDCEHYIIPDMPGCDFTIRAGGRSMINRNFPERSINDRDIVGCRIVKSRSHVRWGEVYALSTYDGIMIKKIEKSEQDGYITCVPFNNDEGFKPYDIPVEEIYDWALVIGVVSVKTWI